MQPQGRHDSGRPGSLLGQSSPGPLSMLTPLMQAARNALKEKSWRALPYFKYGFAGDPPSPFSSSSRSGMMGCGGVKLLCTLRMASLLPMARPAGARVYRWG
jgi:hypothetical protein